MLFQGFQGPVDTLLTVEERRIVTIRKYLLVVDKEEFSGTDSSCRTEAAPA